MCFCHLNLVTSKSKPSLIVLLSYVAHSNQKMGSLCKSFWSYYEFVKTVNMLDKTVIHYNEQNMLLDFFLKVSHVLCL